MIIIVTLSLILSSTAYASGNEEDLGFGRTSFWNWMEVMYLPSIFQTPSGCEHSTDGEHHWIREANGWDLFALRCNDCGVWRDEWMENRYKESLVNATGSDGLILSQSDADGAVWYKVNCISTSFTPYNSRATCVDNSTSNYINYSINDTNSSWSTSGNKINISAPINTIAAPISGTYQPVFVYSFYGTCPPGYSNQTPQIYQNLVYPGTLYATSNNIGGKSGVVYAESWGCFAKLAGSTLNSLGNDTYIGSPMGCTIQVQAIIYLKVTPQTTGYSAQLYEDNSLNGFSGRSGKFGYVDEDGQEQVIETTFIDETNKRYYVPISNTWIDYNTFNYDFTTRSYTFDTGDTITYEDNSVTQTIVDNSVTNIYNYYYYVDNSGGGDEPGNTSGIIAWLENIFNKLEQIYQSVVGIEENISGDDEVDNETFIYNFKMKFAFIGDIKDIGDSFITDITTDQLGASSGASPPVITIDLSAADSPYGYVYGSEMTALDLSWYADYKPTVDAIMSGFLWVLFLWGLFKAAPGIISGIGITNNRIEDDLYGWRGQLK